MLEPGESFTVAWTIFPHDGEADFHRLAAKYSPKFIDITANRWLLFKGERIKLVIEPRFDFTQAHVTRGGKVVDFTREGNVLRIESDTDEIGEYRYEIEIDGVKTFCELLVQPELEELAAKRLYFIVDNQQYNRDGSALDGVFLEYDNIENHMRYASIGDHNASRERIGMGLAIARYLRTHENQKLAESLKRYTTFIYRELFDEQTGEVFNDYLRNNSRPRLYNNYPWFSLYFTELYELYGDVKYLKDAAKASLAYYERGTNSPAHEVRYEQSIVAPPPSCCCRSTESPEIQGISTAQGISSRCSSCSMDTSRGFLPRCAVDDLPRRQSLLSVCLPVHRER